MEIEDIKKLANLARVEMGEDEMREIANSFGPILEYVGHIKEISETEKYNDEIPKASWDVPFNILREDVVTNDKKEFTDKIIKEMPESQDGYLKVKQIL